MKAKTEANSRAMTTKYTLSLPPYQAVVEHTDFILDKYSTGKYQENDVTDIKRISSLISKDLDKDINEKLRIIEIEKDLIKLIEPKEKLKKLLKSLMEQQ